MCMFLIQNLFCVIILIFIKIKYFREEHHTDKQEDELPPMPNPVLDGKYFEITEHQNNDNIKCKCTTCGKLIAAAMARTSNLYSHIKVIIILDITLITIFNTLLTLLLPSASFWRKNK